LIAAEQFVDVAVARVFLAPRCTHDRRERRAFGSGHRPAPPINLYGNLHNVRGEFPRLIGGEAGRGAGLYPDVGLLFNASGVDAAVQE
jgi:hypothetical protein